MLIVCSDLMELSLRLQLSTPGSKFGNSNSNICLSSSLNKGSSKKQQQQQQQQSSSCGGIAEEITNGGPCRNKQRRLLEHGPRHTDGGKGNRRGTPKTSER